MSDKRSYSALEKAYRHELRDRLNKCEDASELERQFSRVVRRFLDAALGEQGMVGDADVFLVPDGPPHYAVSDLIRGLAPFQKAMEESDLPDILARFAETARKDHTHLRKVDPQAEQKIRNPQRR